jgi:hypothetical protein
VLPARLSDRKGHVLTRQVTDIPIAHPSCSKQHAVIQFRQITEKNEYGETTTSVK